MRDMQTKTFKKLSDELASKVEQFELENFYSGKENVEKRRQENKEKYFSFPKAWLLAFEDNQIIGRIMLHKRTIKFGDKDIILGGVGGVCTRRDKRRQGIATKMLGESMKILREWECDVGFLCADIEKNGLLYTQVGFVPLNKPYTYYGRSGKLYEENYGMIAPINSQNLFEELLNSDQKFHLGEGNW